MLLPPPFGKSKVPVTWELLMPSNKQAHSTRRVQPTPVGGFLHTVTTATAIQVDLQTGRGSRTGCLSIGRRVPREICFARGSRHLHHGRSRYCRRWFLNSLLGLCPFRRCPNSGRCIQGELVLFLPFFAIFSSRVLTVSLRADFSPIRLKFVHGQIPVLGLAAGLGR